MVVDRKGRDLGSLFTCSLAKDKFHFVQSSYDIPVNMAEKNTIEF